MKSLIIVSTLLLAAVATAQPPATIDAGELSRHVKALASDAFEGRGPGTTGEQRTIAYLAEQFAAAGASPGGEDGSWTQAVEMNQYRIAGTPQIALGGAGECAFDLEDSTVIWTRNAAPRFDVVDAPVLFGGYGIHAPELGWDDYEGVDLRGKVVVLLANDPDHQSQSGPFGGAALSYYGRIGAKVEEAGRRGALAVLVVHHDEYVGMGWEFSKGAYSSPANALAGGDDGRVGFTAWLKLDAAERLFRCAGLNLEDLRRAAQQPGFRGRALNGPSLTAHFSVAVENTVTHNVVAILPGTSHPGRDLHLHRPLGPSRPRPPRFDRRHDL